MKKMCDKCGKTFDPMISDNQSFDYELTIIKPSGRIVLELCPKCKNSLHHWFWYEEDK